jgi:hypothetical protein
MILEARIDPKLSLLIDCETSAAIDKSEGGGQADPDKVLDNLRALVQTVASELAAGLQLTAAQGVNVDFAVRINANGTVVVAQRPTDGQFRVTLKVA